MLAMGFVAGVTLYLAYIAARCVFRIEEGHVAVITTFGAPLETADGKLKLAPPGLHLKLPWQVLHRVPLMEQVIDLSGPAGARSVMTDDGTVLRVDSILRLSPDEDKIRRYLFDLKEPKKHIAELFTCLLRNELANVRPSGERGEVEGPGGSLALVRRDRRRLNDDIMSFCQREIGDVYGVTFHAVDLIDIRPPDELDEALNAVMSAQSEAERVYARTEAECQRRTIAARRGVEVATLNAQAVEREIHSIVHALHTLEKQGTLEAYVQRRRTEVLSQAKLHYVRSHAASAATGSSLRPIPRDVAPGNAARRIGADGTKSGVTLPLQPAE